MHDQVNQVQVFYDDTQSKAEDKANEFLRTIHKKNLVQVHHAVEFNDIHKPPLISILVVYKEAVDD